MNRQRTLIAAALLFLLFGPAFSQDAPSAEIVLRRVADKLGSVKALGYKYRFELKDPSQARFFEEKTDAYLELRPANAAERFRYQFVSVNRFSVYNGSEQFTTDNKTKKLHVDSNPSFKSFGNILLQNSPLALKYALPAIIADKAIAKKLSVRDANSYSIEFALPKRVINASGEIVEIRPDHLTIYRLTVDKNSHLPVEVVQSNDKNPEVLTTMYSELTEQPPVPAANSWYFSTYQAEYKLEKKEDFTLVEPGKMPAGFSLAEYNSTARVSLDKFKDKMVLLEFWIAHCSFCIAAVPRLNELNEKYKEKGFEVVSINMYDPAAAIEFFKKKNKPEFAILTGGDSIAAAYGVDAYPALVLIGRSGRVIYSSSGLQEKELEAAILANLKE